MEQTHEELMKALDEATKVPKRTMNLELLDEMIDELINQLYQLSKIKKRWKHKQES